MAGLGGLWGAWEALVEAAVAVEPLLLAVALEVQEDFRSAANLNDYLKSNKREE